MPKKLTTHVCATIKMSIRRCGLGVHERSVKLCTVSSLYTKYTHKVFGGVYQPVSCERVFIQFSPTLSTSFSALFHLLRTWLCTLSTAPITTRTFSKNHIFINNQGARA
jgi:hypothetical protein